jgi:putative addiction module component (TIGR02574 family)
MATLTKPQIDALTLEEKLKLIDDLEESLLDTLEDLPTPEWHLQLIEERLAEAERNPGAGIPWEVVRAEMEKKWLR